MSTVINPNVSNVVQDEPKPFTEVSHVPTFPYNAIISLTLINSDPNHKEKVLDQELSTLFQEYLKGMGTVELVELEIVYLINSEGGSITAGLTSTFENLTINQLKTSQFSFSQVATAITKGHKITEVLRIPAEWSARLQVPSSERPPVKLKIRTSSSVDCTIRAKIHYFGVLRYNAEKDLK